jgi:hypothetical protein
MTSTAAAAASIGVATSAVLARNELEDATSGTDSATVAHHRHVDHQKGLYGDRPSITRATRAATHGQAVRVRGTDRDSDEAALLSLFDAIAAGDRSRITRTLDAAPGLATRPLRIGASRQDPDPYFLVPIHHYVYAGDTALHVAAAAHQRGVAESLVALGAPVRHRNRRGAEPLHYAADGRPGADGWDADAQREVIGSLIRAGADPDAMDKSGVAPLHRAVRTRSSRAVSALIEGGADPLLMNRSGSTPLHLAVQNTGKSNSGSEAAKEEQHRIIVVLLQHGARPTDPDARGRTAADSASSDWIRQLLDSQ